MTLQRSAPRRLLPWLAALLAPALFVACSGGEEEKENLVGKIPPEEAVVIIDGHEVSGAWLRNMAVSQEILARQALPGVPFEVNQHSLIRSARDLLTKINVVAMEAERRGLEVTDEEISDALSEEVGQYESTEAWRQRLEDSGLTVEERREQIRIELLFDAYREEIVRPRVEERFATTENVRKFYEKHPDLWQEPMQIHLYHIHRTVAKDAPESERERERAKIEEARRRIEEGESFEEVAREVSTEESALRGGELGWVNESWPINEELKEPSLALDEGELSEIIESSMGYHLFWAKERKEAGQKPFEEVKADIKERILREAVTRSMERDIAELRQQAEIKYLDLTPFIGEPPAPEDGPGGGSGGAPVPARPAEEPSGQEG
jgi:parvulin-like peptidyl-prolyl isomerase